VRVSRAIQTCGSVSSSSTVPVSSSMGRHTADGRSGVYAE
jgi:hypothetical protein